MNILPTAKEFCDGYLGKDCYPTDTPEAMISFTILHLQGALSNANSAAKMYNLTDNIKNDILNCYALTNIK